MLIKKCLDTGPIERKELSAMKRRTCPNPDCGKDTRTIGDFCPYCATSLTPIDSNVINDENEGGSTMSTTKKIVGGIVIALLLLGAYWLGTINNGKSTANSNVVASTNTEANNIPATTIPVIHPGLDQPSKSWFLAKSGTLISGDVAIFDNDNNSKKTPVYDSQESTADIIYLTSDTYVWAEWGCHEIEIADAKDVATLINDKLTNGNFKTVRYFNGFNKLGTNTPTLITSKIDASAITLPAVTK